MEIGKINSSINSTQGSSKYSKLNLKENSSVNKLDYSNFFKDNSNIKLHLSDNAKKLIKYQRQYTSKEAKIAVAYLFDARNESFVKFSSQHENYLKDIGKSIYTMLEDPSKRKVLTYFIQEAKELILKNDFEKLKELNSLVN